jgi:thymidylate kinase
MGRLVALEGPDLVGKTTLCRHLTLKLRERGLQIKVFRFPPDERSREVDHLYEVFTGSGDPMKQQLALVNIFNAYGPRILAALRDHDIVLIDRYILSVLATCKALDLDFKLVMEALRRALIPPDLTVIYTGTPFHLPKDDPPERKEFREKIMAIFEAEIPEYRHPVLRVTNQAAHEGHFPEFLDRLADQILERLGLPRPTKPSGGT